MGVIGTAHELPDTGEFQFEIGKYSIRRRYRVICSDVNDDALVATSATGLPVLFSTYVSPNSFNRCMRARRYEARRLLPASKVWIVTVVYETPERKEGTGGTGGGTGQEQDSQFNDPTLELPEVDFHTLESEEVLTQIYDVATGNYKPPTNSAGFPEDPPPKYMATRLRLTIDRNEPVDAPYPARAILYMNAVNSDVFWGQPPGVWRCRAINPKRAVRQLAGTTVAFLRVRYEFEGRPTWDIIKLDKGPKFWRIPAAAIQTQVPSQASQMQGVPILPPTNPNNGVPPPPLPGGLTIGQTRMIPDDFQSARGHPGVGPLNGQGGPLPEPSTFTIGGITGLAGGFIVVPPASPSRPGVYVNGLAVQVWNTSGSLPAGLAPNAVYYTCNVQPDGSFQLQTTPGDQVSVLNCYGLFGAMSISTFDPWSVVSIVQPGWTASGPGIQPGTLVQSVTAGGLGSSVIQLTLPTSAALNNTPVAFTAPVNLVNIGSLGSGLSTIKPLGVWQRIQPYRRLPFSALGLPQTFNDVQ